MVSSHKTTRLRLMLAPIGAMLVMAGALIVGAYSLQRDEIADDHSRALYSVDAMLKQIVTSESDILNGCLDEALCDTSLIPAFVKRDRDALYQQAKPAYDRMARRVGVSHFYFIDPDRNCFLRVHRPAQHSDPITRKMLTQVIDSGRDMVGLELGKRGTFTLRAIRPLYAKDKCVGYLEIGKDISRLTPHLKGILKSDMLFLVGKQYMDQAGYSVITAMAGNRQPWNTMKTDVIVDCTLWPVPAKLLETIDSHSPTDTQWTCTATLSGRHFLAGAVPLIDATGDAVGQIVVISDITALRVAMWRTVLHTALIGIALIAALILVIRHITRRVLDELLAAEANLLHEIDHRRDIERALHERTRFLDTLIDTIPNPVFYKDERYLYRGCNRAFASLILGIDKSDLIGKSVYDLPGLIPPDLADLYHQHDVALMNNPGVQCYEETVLCADHHRRAFQFYKATIADDNGRPAGVVGIMMDLTEQKKASRSLERFRAALDRTADMLFLIDRQTLRFVDINDVACAQLGYGRRDLMSLSPVQIAPKIQRDTMIKTLDDIIDRRIPRSVIEMPLERRDGTQFPAEVHMHPMVTENEMLIVATARDITDRRRTEQQLHHANMEAQRISRAKDEFLASMSHEIRTPMTAILGYAELLRDHHRACPNSSREYVQAADTVLRNGRYLLELVNDLLDLSKIEAGEFSVHLEPCNPEQIVEHVITSLRVRAAEKHLTLTAEHHDALPRQILSSPIRLQQILANLVVNAIKFTDTGSVSIETSLVHTDDGQSILFKVIDTGIGMTSDDLANIFDPFKQSAKVASRPNNGTGLGLTISKRLAHLLGGEITVTSEPDHGSTFTLTLKVRIPAATLDPADTPYIDNELHALTEFSADTPTSPVAISGRILLAEDGPDNQRLLSHFLTRAGATVTLAENGQQAFETAHLAHLEKRDFDLILMDMQMPVMDGFEATRRLRSDGYTAPIVALTAHAMLSDRERCIAAGCDGFVTKPINRRQLIAAVSKYLKGGTSSMESSSIIRPEGLLISEFADDPDMLELIQMFVDELPQRISAIQQALESNDIELLTRLAHQLKGAAGGYGFPAVSDASKTLEKAAKDHHAADTLEQMVNDLADTCRRVGSTLTAPE